MKAELATLVAILSMGLVCIFAFQATSVQFQLRRLASLSNSAEALNSTEIIEIKSFSDWDLGKELHQNPNQTEEEKDFVCHAKVAPAKNKEECQQAQLAELGPRAKFCFSDGLCMIGTQSCGQAAVGSSTCSQWHGKDEDSVRAFTFTAGQHDKQCLGWCHALKEKACFYTDDKQSICMCGGPHVGACYIGSFRCGHL